MKRLNPMTVAALVLFAGLAFGAPALHQVLAIFQRGVKIGSTGTAIDDSYAGQIAWQFADVLANTCAESAALTVTGAALGDTCEATNVLATPAADAGISYQLSCRVSAANTVRVRACADQNINLGDAGYNIRTFDP